ncbi:MAG: serine/threonine protein kinase [Planctomycetes bacterium]|nr:serine/threonine protein kinase [Planctomycetota bacterium]
MTSQDEYALAEKAVRECLITAEELEECVRHQRSAGEAGNGTPLLRVLVERGCLTSAQVQALAAGTGTGSSPEADEIPEIAPMPVATAPALPVAVARPAAPASTARPGQPAPPPRAVAAFHTARPGPPLASAAARPPAESPSDANIPTIQPLPTPSMSPTTQAAPPGSPPPSPSPQPAPPARERGTVREGGHAPAPAGAGAGPASVPRPPQAPDRNTAIRHPAQGLRPPGAPAAGPRAASPASPASGTHGAPGTQGSHGTPGTGTQRVAGGPTGGTSTPPRPVPSVPGGAPGPRPGSGTSPTEPIPGYKVVGNIGKGGMAAVFRAERVKTRQICALKILFPHRVKVPLFLNRFLREAKLLTEFNHENIVRGIDFGTANGLYYLAMELIEGRSVQSLIDERGALDEETALSILLQIARALEYSEDKGILHRDIKPDNILITPQGVVKLCDLGFAKPIGTPEEEAGESTCGTPQYMSPEQAQGARDLDIRSDIYSLGATLFHMITGDVPFKGTDNMEIMAKQVLEELKSSEVKNRKISRHVHYFIEKMMAKEKDLRYETARQVIEEIEAQVEGFKSLQYNPPPERESTRIIDGMGDLKDGPRRGGAARPEPRPAGDAPRAPLSAMELMRRRRLDALSKKAPPPGKGKPASDSDTGFHFGRKR